MTVSAGIRTSMDESRTLQRLHALYRVTAMADRPYAEQFQSLLQAGSELLGMELGFISHIQGQAYTVLYAVSPTNIVRPGQQFELGQTLCDATLRQGDLLHYADIRPEDYLRLPAARELKLRAYMGVPIMVDGKSFGTLNFSSTQPHLTPFDEADQDFFRLIASWVSATLERQIKDEALRASEARWRSLITNSTDIIIRVDKNYHFLELHAPPAIAQIFEHVDITEFSDLDFVLDDDKHIVKQAIDTSFRTGQPQYYECRGIDLRGFVWYLCRAMPIFDGDTVVSVQIVLSDITGRKEAEAALERERNLLRALISASPDAVYIKDRQSQFTLANVPLALILGQKQVEEVLGKSDADFQPAHLAAQFRREEQRVMETGIPLLDREEYNPLWDGKPRWFSTTKAPFYDDQGQIIGVVGITRDITARKLTESENTRLFETSLDLLGSSNGSHYVRLNPAWERTLGYTRDELYQMPYLGLVHPDDLERTLSNSIPLANGTPIMGFRNRLRAKDGSWRWIDWDVVPDLQMGLIHLTGRDVTSDKLLEDQFDIQHKALLESESRFRQMAETIEDCFWMYDPLADEMIYVSPSYERITGHPVSFLYDNPNAHLELIAPEDRERISRLWSTPTSVFDERYRILRPDGIMAWVWESTYVACNDEGAPYRVIGILRDITPDKLIEQRIHEQNEILQATNHDLEIARSQAEEASRLKSRFLATMSHELRTPLNAIIGYTQLQQAGMAGPISSLQEEYLNRTLVNAEDLLRLINEVLDLSKIEAGRMELARKPFSPAQLLQEITSQHQVLAEAKRLTFSLTGQEALPPWVIGDAGRVKQIIVNVVANAIKFTEQGSVHLQTCWDADGWQVNVQDSGIGIPPEMQQTIFDEFRQVDGGLTRPYGGSGLGLSIVKKLIRLMNGNIQVSSRVGQGSTFTLCLPLPVPQESLSQSLRIHDD